MALIFQEVREVTLELKCRGCLRPTFHSFIRHCTRQTLITEQRFLKQPRRLPFHVRSVVNMCCYCYVFSRISLFVLHVCLLFIVMCVLDMLLTKATHLLTYLEEKTKARVKCAYHRLTHI